MCTISHASGRDTTPRAPVNITASLSAIRLPHMLRWKIGDVTVTRIVEMVAELDPVWFFPMSTPEAWSRHRSWLVPNFVNEDGQVLQSIHMFVVQSQGQTIIVD